MGIPVPAAPGRGEDQRLAWAGGVVATMAAFFALAKIDMTIAERRRHDD